MATSEYVATGADKELVDRVTKHWDACRSHHQQFCNLYEKRERSYRGVLAPRSKAASWKHQAHPPYAFNLLETVIASSVEQGLMLTARPSPHGQMSLEEAKAALDKAEDVEDLLRHEHRIDDMDDKQRPLYLTAAIGGRGILKDYWNYSEGSTRRQGIQNTEIHDADGNSLGSVPTVTEIVENGVLRDHSTSEVVDPRDFVTHEGARALQPWEPGGAQYLFHRCHYSFEQLKMMEKSGFFKNVDYLKESRSQTGSEYTDRGSQVYQMDRTKDQIEVLEYWCMENGQVHRGIIGNKKVVLRSLEANPFWHGGYPFIICSSMPQPFQTIGMSEVELIEQLQEMLWEFQNQRLDNLELVNNAIYLIRSDIEDPDSFQPFPGAKWMVEDPQQVEALTPPYQAAEISIHAEALLKGDLQNVSGAAPFAGGTETASVDQKTATGASMVMNAAQQRLAYRKYEFQKALRREANMRLKNCQQFMDTPKLAHIIGPDGAMAFKEINPLEIQGEYLFELEPMGESQMRQEKRGEATQFFQVAMAAAGVMAAAKQPLNLMELFRWYAKKWDIPDAERFLSQNPDALGAMQAAGGQGGQGAAGPQDANLGITASSAVDAGSPSAVGGISGSPATAVARALSMGGGQGGPNAG